MKLPAPTVLIGEGDPFSLNLLDEACRGAGFDVVAAISGAEVLEHVARRPPVLALIAANLEGPDGFEVLGVLKQDGVLDAIPVVIAIQNDEQRDRAEELGAEGVVNRPYVLVDVQARVIEALRVARDRRRHRRESIPLIPMEAADPDTGCGSRAQLLLTLDYEVTRAERFTHPLSCLMLSFQEEVPADVLRELAEEVRQALRAMDGLFRSRSAELTAVLPETSQEGRDIVQARLIKMLRGSPWAHKGLSIGSHTIPAPTYITGEELLSQTRERLEAL